MKLISAHGECQRCSAKWDAANAMAVAAQHETRTGHPVKVVLTYEQGGISGRRRRDRDERSLPFGNTRDER